MNGDELLAAMNDFVDGQRNSPLSTALKAHLDDCQACRTTLENVRDTIAVYQAASPPAPDGLHDRLRETLRLHWQEASSDDTNRHHRRVIFEELCKVTSHPTAVEMREMARFRLPTISLSNVRRHLDFLVQFGAIQKIEAAGFEPRFDGNPDPHDHLRCTSCGRVDDSDRVAADSNLWSRGNLRRVEAADRRVEFVGTCGHCGN